MNAERLAELEEEFNSELVLEALDLDGISDDRLEAAHAVLTGDKGSTRDADVEEALTLLTGDHKADTADPPRTTGEFEEVTDDDVGEALNLFS